MGEDMAKFTDRQGGEWVLTLTVETIRRVRSETGYDLAAVFTAEGMTKLTDPSLLVDVLCSVVGGQLASKQLTPKQFGELFDGDSLESAANALLEASVDFLPSGRREVIRKLWSKADEVATAASEVLAAKIEGLSVADVLSVGTRPQTSGSN